MADESPAKSTPAPAVTLVTYANKSKQVISLSLVGGKEVALKGGERIVIKSTEITPQVKGLIEKGFIKQV